MAQQKINAPVVSNDIAEEMPPPTADGPENAGANDDRVIFDS